MKKTRRQYSTEQTVKKLRDAEAAVNHFLENMTPSIPKPVSARERTVRRC